MKMGDALSPDRPNPFSGMDISHTQKTALRKQLEALSEGSRDPRIKEMARDVLAGKLDLRAAMLGSRYEDALAESVAHFSSWYRGLSEDELAQQEQRARGYLEELRREAAAEQAGRGRPRRASTEDDWEPPASIFRREPPRR